MQNGAGGAIRTRTPLQTTRFELVTYTIPSLRHNKWRRVEDSNPWASSRRPPLSKRLLWATQPTLLMKQWRKGWDSNPRRFFKPQPFSRRQPSTGLGHPSVILCSGAGRRQEASSQDTPRSRGHETRPLMLVDRQGDSNSHEIASHVPQTCVSAIPPWRRIWCG